MLVVENEPAALERIERELGARYGADYAITCTSSSAQGLQRLERLRAEGRQVALVLADQWMPEITGSELLAQVGELHPHAKRGLLVDGALGEITTRPRRW